MFDLRRCSAVCAIGACLAAPPAGAEPAEPLGQGAKLCLYPMQLPFSESRAEARRPALQGKLIDALAAASFDVADPEAVKALEERVRKETGGFVDPALGWRDVPRFRAYREQLGNAQRDELGCDAELHASIATLQATFISGVARWDGTSQQVSSTGRIVMNVLAGVQESGWVSAFSLWLQVTDLAGKNVAFRSAGIETPVTFAVVEDQDVVPEDRWLTDEVRFGDAIRSALGPLGEALRLQGRP